MAPANCLLLADGDDEGAIHPEGGYRCSADCREAYHYLAIPAKMFDPFLGSRIEEVSLLV